MPEPEWARQWPKAGAGQSGMDKIPCRFWHRRRIPIPAKGFRFDRLVACGKAAGGFQLRLPPARLHDCSKFARLLQSKIAVILTDRKERTWTGRQRRTCRPRTLINDSDSFAGRKFHRFLRSKMTAGLLAVKMGLRNEKRRMTFRRRFVPTAPHNPFEKGLTENFQQKRGKCFHSPLHLVSCRGCCLYCSILPPICLPNFTPWRSSCPPSWLPLSGRRLCLGSASSPDRSTPSPPCPCPP